VPEPFPNPSRQVQNPLLEVSRLNVFRGATHVLRDVSFSVGKGELVALMGANGAGKTTTLLALSAILPVRGGSATLHLESGRLALCQSRAEDIVRAGLIHCPEGRQIFQSLSVEENLRLGAYRQSDRARTGKSLQEVYRLFPVLYQRRKGVAGMLSGGEQMMLALGRALLGQPKLLLLDEPSLGLAPKVCETLFDVIKTLKAQGVTIVLVEQNAALALELADWGYVMENGSISLGNSGKALQADDRVRRTYLGMDGYQG